MPLPDPRLGRFGRAGGLVAGLLAIAELVRILAARGPLMGWGEMLSQLGATLFIVLLAITSVGLLARRRFGWAFGVFGGLVGLAYAVMITTGGAGHTHAMWGVGYLLGAGVLLGCLAKSLAFYRVEVPVA